jgi:5-deoxy-glucuronate isomerase
MPALIEPFDNGNLPILDRHPLLPRTFFNVLRLAAGESHAATLPGFESVWVVLSGTCDVRVGKADFRDVGTRPDIWSGNADSVYAPAGAQVRVTARTACELAVAGGRCDKPYEPFRVSPAEVDPVEVGSHDTHSRRVIKHVLGKNADGRAGNLLVSELYAEAGCWSGYPPHKHDEDRPDGSESGFEEAYHYRFRPQSGFGAQLVFQPDGTRQAFMTTHGSTMLVDRGYHPTVTSPGHDEYIFTVLVGHSRRSLVQYFKEEYRYLMKVLPGVQDMIDKFK